MEKWRREYNTINPHNSLKYWPAAPEAVALVPSFTFAGGAGLN